MTARDIEQLILKSELWLCALDADLTPVALRHKEVAIAFEDIDVAEIPFTSRVSEPLVSTLDPVDADDAREVTEHGGLTLLR